MNLKVYYVSWNRVRVDKLKIQVCPSKKDKFVTVYVFYIKKYIDSLATIGSPISNDDHVEAILANLPEEFDDFIIAILSKLDPCTIK